MKLEPVLIILVALAVSGGGGFYFRHRYQKQAPQQEPKTILKYFWFYLNRKTEIEEGNLSQMLKSKGQHKQLRQTYIFHYLTSRYQVLMLELEQKSLKVTGGLICFETNVFAGTSLEMKENLRLFLFKMLPTINVEVPY